jgi:hypothetical protein
MTKDHLPAKVRFVCTCCYLCAGNLLDHVNTFIVQVHTKAFPLDRHFHSPRAISRNKREKFGLGTSKLQGIRATRLKSFSPGNPKPSTSSTFKSRILETLNQTERNSNLN